MKKSWQYLHERFYSVGVAPKAFILDNETSNILQTAMKNYKTNYQLVPPHTHRENYIERYIQNFKNDYKYGLSSLDPYFPISEWD